MIILILIILAIFFFVACNLIIKNKSIHRIASTISTILICLAIGLVIANFRYHYGMHLQNITTTKCLKPATKQTDIIIKQPLGYQKKHNMIIYRKSTHSIKPIHTKLSDKVSNHIRVTQKRPKLIVTNRKWEYKNGLDKLMFDLAMKPKNSSTKNVFYIPKDWTILSAKQAKLVKKNAKMIAKQNKAKMSSPITQQAMKMQLQQGIQAKLAQMPNVTPQQKQAMIKKFTKQAKIKMMKQAKSSIIQKSILLAKQNR